MSSDRFTQFVKLLSDSGLVFENDDVEVIRGIVEQVYEKAEVQPKPSKPKTAYSLYVTSETLRLKKETKMTAAERQQFISAGWKALKAMSPEERKKAVGEVVVVTTSPASPKKRKPTGYNMFMKNQMAELKTKGVPVAERMAQVSAMWKALSDEEKKKWTPTA